MKNIIKKYSEITHAEWIIYNWIQTTVMSSDEPEFLRGLERPLDEAMKLSGGSIETLKPYLWVLRHENK